MAFHTKRSPSRAKQFIGCPGTLAFCSTLPEEQRASAGEAAQLGTATHAIIERCLSEGSEPAFYEDRIVELLEKPDGEEGTTILKPNAKTPGPGRTFFIVDESMIHNATIMTDYVRERLEELGLDEKDLELETRTNPLPDRDDTSGTADVTLAALKAGVLEVDDYKNGYLTVEHKDNPQTLAYLLGKAIEKKFAFKIYRALICQPRADHEEGAIRYVELTKRDLLDFQKEYRAAIERCEEAEAAFEKAGTKGRDKWAAKWLSAGEHCTFCEAQAICPARRLAAEEQAKIDFADEPQELEIHLPVKAEGRQAANSDLVHVARILSWAPMLEALIKAANIYAQRAMEAGYEVKGQKLVARRSIRKLNPELTEKEIADALVKGGYIKDATLLYSPRKLRSGPQIEKLIPTKAKRKKFAKEFLVKPDAGLTIAPVDDPRPAVEATAGDDFADDIEDDEFNFG